MYLHPGFGGRFACVHCTDASLFPRLRPPAVHALPPLNPTAARPASAQEAHHPLVRPGLPVSDPEGERLKAERAP